MASDSDVIIVPIQTDKEETLFIEVENKYGPGWDISPSIPHLSVRAILQAMTKLVTLAIENENIKNVTMEFGLSAQMEERSLKIFLARSTTPHLLKFTIEAERPDMTATGAALASEEAGSPAGPPKAPS